MKNILEWFSLITTPVSFVISIVTLVLSLKIKSKINTAIDRSSLYSRMPDIEEQLEQFTKMLSGNADYSSLTELRHFLIMLCEEYSYLDKRLILTLKNSIKLLSIPKTKSMPDSDLMQLSDNLVTIKTMLIKEVKQYER